MVNKKSSHISVANQHNLSSLPLYHSAKVRNTQVLKDRLGVDSIGSINIITAENGGSVSAAGFHYSATGRDNETKPKVVDLNRITSFPLNNGRKKNKNDFYRFLLQQNFGSGMEGEAPFKINNDILIPRSILKKHDAPKRYMAEKEDLDDFEELLGTSNLDQININETVVGKHLDKDGPMLSPKTYSHNFLQN